MSCNFFERIGGHCSEIFVLKPDDTYECPICFDILNDPRSCKIGHSFCFDCISDVLKKKEECPICKIVLTSNSLVYNLLARKVVDKMETTCASRDQQVINEQNIVSACNWTGPLCARKKHFEEECDYFPLKCENVGCGENLARKLFSYHSDNCEFTPMLCDLCGDNSSQTYLRKELHFHKNVCDYRPISCPNNCSAMILFNQINSHIYNDCFRTIVECPLHKPGLCINCPVQAEKRVILHHVLYGDKSILQFVEKLFAPVRTKIEYIETQHDDKVVTSSKFVDDASVRTVVNVETLESMFMLYESKSEMVAKLLELAHNNEMVDISSLSLQLSDAARNHPISQSKSSKKNLKKSIKRKAAVNGNGTFDSNPEHTNDATLICELSENGKSNSNSNSSSNNLACDNDIAHDSSSFIIDEQSLSPHELYLCIKQNSEKISPVISHEVHQYCKDSIIELKIIEQKKRQLQIIKCLGTTPTSYVFSRLFLDFVPNIMSNICVQLHHVKDNTDNLFLFIQYIGDFHEFSDLYLNVCSADELTEVVTRMFISDEHSVVNQLDDVDEKSWTFEFFIQLTKFLIAMYQPIFTEWIGSVKENNIHMSRLHAKCIG